ncbi:MAG: hypothetical protein ACLUKM_04760 [Lactococcus lactis]
MLSGTQRFSELLRLAVSLTNLHTGGSTPVSSVGALLILRSYRMGGTSPSTSLMSARTSSDTASTCAESFLLY